MFFPDDDQILWSKHVGGDKLLCFFWGGALFKTAFENKYIDLMWETCVLIWLPIENLLDIDNAL